MKPVLTILFSYLLGAVPAAYLAGRWGKGIDLRREGSGNLGFTNALRVLGPRWGVPVLLFDLVKGMAAVWFCRALIPGEETLVILGGLAAIVGHNWTVFLGFRGGGKGVATSAGVFAALSPAPFGAALIVFLVLLFGVKYMSVASIGGALTLAGSAAGLRWTGSSLAPSYEVMIFSIVAALLVIVRHHANIRRLIQGTESRFQFRHKEPNE